MPKNHHVPLKNNVNKIMLTLFLFYIITGCNSSSENKISITRDTVTFNSGNEVLAQTINWHFFETENDVYLACYDFILHKLLIISYTTRNLIKAIPLANEGPNSVDVLAYKAFDINHHFLLSAQSYFIIDSTGKVVKKVNFYKNHNKLKNFDSDKYQILPSTDIYSSFNKKNDLFFVSLNDDEFLAAIHLTNDSLIYYRLNRPSFFNSGYKYNNKAQANLTVEPDRIIYNFPALSNFYIYEFSDGKISEIKATSDYTAEESPPYIRGKYFPATSLNYLHELFYKRIYFDQTNSRYYGLHFAKSNDTNESGIKSYLRIFNKDFQKIHEIQMDSDLKPVPIFIDNKVLMRTMNSEKENKIEFIELTIE